MDRDEAEAGRARGGRGGEERDQPEWSEAEASPSLPSEALAVRAWRPRPHEVRHDRYSEIWRLAWPVMLTQGLLSAVSLIDIAMIGRLGRDAVAAAGYSTQFFFLAMASLFAVGFACVALMARAIGAGDPARARQAMAASLLVAFATSLVLAGVVIAFPGQILGLLGATPEIIALATPYLRLMMAGSVLLSLSLTLENALRADKDPVTPLLIGLGVTAVKIVLNALLIFGLLGAPRLELAGAGLATIGSQVAAVALFALVLRRPAAGSPTALRPRDFFIGLPLLRDVVRLSLPGVGERLVMNLAMLFYFSVLSAYGATEIAVYTIGIRVLSFSWIPGTAIATAAATLVGQSLGAGQPGGARRAGWRAVGLALGIAAGLGLLGAVFRYELASVFTNDAVLVQGLGPFMLCLALALPAMQVHFTLAGAHRGAGDTWTPLLSAAVSNWVFRVPLACLFAYALHTDVIWVWLALVTDHATRALWLTLSFRRGHWLTRYAPSQPGPKAAAARNPAAARPSS